jgi:hypothetical protein
MVRFGAGLRQTWSYLTIDIANIVRDSFEANMGTIITILSFHVARNPSTDL